MIQTLYKKDSSVTITTPDGCTAADLGSAEIREPKWLIPGMIPAGLAVLGADPKSGKTVWGMQLASCVASRDEEMTFLDRKMCHGTVVYMDLESSLRRSRNRLVKMGLDLDEMDRLLIVNDEVSRLGEGLEEQIELYAHTYADLRLVVIDTLSKVAPPSQSFIKDSRFYHSLREKATQLGITVLVLHHLSKSKHREDPIARLYGTQALAANADALMVLEREHRTQNLFNFLGVGNDLENVEETLQFSLMHWSVCDTGENGDSSDLIQAVLEDPTFEALEAALYEYGENGLRFTPQWLVDYADEDIGDAGDVTVWMREYASVLSQLLSVFISERRSGSGTQFSLLRVSDEIVMPCRRTVGPEDTHHPVRKRRKKKRT